MAKRRKMDFGLNTGMNESIMSILGILGHMITIQKTGKTA